MTIRCIQAILLLLFLTISVQGQEELYECQNGNIKIESDAPLELITASTSELKGFINTLKNSFAFQVKVNTITGFNSPLQQEHFYENYMETEKYPYTSFSGKIIEKINYSEEGNYNIRAKGIFSVHGVEVERIINCTLKIEKDQFIIESSFNVPIADHNISIPKLVNLKIAEEIKIEVVAVFVPSVKTD
jgi:hypothetical protein